MHAAVIVADDLTGAMDTAHGFAARGHGTAVLAAPGAYREEGPGAEASPVLGVNTESRYADRQRAADAVSDAIGAVPAEVVYKKVDSTLRGNVGPEVDAALDAAGADFALVAPAFPAAGRTTEDGIHYVEGTPVAETEYGEDEKGPTSSQVADTFAAVDRPIENVRLPVVEAGPDSVASAVRNAVDRNVRAPVVVCDAETADHLAVLADAAAEFDTLYVGSGGLAERVPVSGDASDGPAELEPFEGAPLGVVGSVSETSLGQLDRLSDEAVFELDPVATLTGAGNDETVTRAAERLGAGLPTVVTAATDHEAVERTRAAGGERGLSPDEIRERVAAALGDAAVRVTRDADLSGLFLTGGDVAVAVMEEFGVTTVELTGDSVGAGIPVGRLADGVATGTPVVTKAGGFGTQGTIVNCLETFLRNDE